MSFGFAKDADARAVFLQSIDEVVVEQRTVNGCRSLLGREDDSRSTSMLLVNTCYGQSHDGTEMQFELTQIGGMTQRHHTCIVRTRREF